MIPLIFLTIPFEWNNKYWNNFLRFFSVVCIIYFSYHIYNGFHIVFDRFNALSHKPTTTFSEYLSTDDFTSRLRRKTNISSRVHQVYMSLFLCWAAIISTSLLFKTRKTIYKIGHGFMALLALICIAVLAARVSLLLTITICSAIIFVKTTLLGKKILIISIPLLFFTLYQIPSIQHRIQKLPTEFTIKNTKELTERQTIFTCSTELLSDNWITGLGLSNVQQELNKCYEGKNSFVVERQYNTHNQYFDILLSSGILGFLSLFALIGYSLYNAIQHKNWLQFLLISIFLINFLTENVFSRFHGIMLFAFFNTAFFKMNSHNSLKEKE